MQKLPAFILYILLFFIGGCDKTIEVSPPVSQATSAQVFDSDAMATSAALGAYLQLRASQLAIANGGVTVLGGLSADELGSTYSEPGYAVFETNELSAETAALNERLWIPAYQVIYHANAVIEGLANANKVSAPVKAHLRGEMLVIRALMHWYLKELFGSSPLVESTNYTITGMLGRAPAREMGAAIVSDLKEARDLLGANPNGYQAGRVSEHAASALLARVYLYQQQWEEAAYYATELIDAGLFQLEPLESVFLSSSKETIWSLQSGLETGYNTAEGVAFIPYDEYSPPNFYLKPALLSAFEDRDERKERWTGASAASGELLYYPSKYKTGYASTITENYVVLRLAEMYLVRAEARAYTGDPEGAVADLNVIRGRAGLRALEYTSDEQFHSAIVQERRLELFCEWGHRWLDLNRWGMADDVLEFLKSPGWQATDKIYPIPFSQTRLNPRLEQNPGYE